MRVTAARRVTPPIATMRRAAEEVPVVGDRLDVVVGVGIEVRAGLPLVASALHHVKKMRDHAGLDDRLTARIEVQPPRIARPVREHLELMPHGMKAPDAGIDLRALVFRGAGLAHLRFREDAVAAVEPAVRSPR